MVSVVFGFGEALSAPLILGEIAFISLLSRFGLLSFVVLMVIGFAPIYYLFVFASNRNRLFQYLTRTQGKKLASFFLQHSRELKFRLFNLAMPVLAGFLTLIHYGSIFRITSIGLFCVLLSIFFKEYLQSHSALDGYDQEKL